MAKAKTKKQKREMVAEELMKILVHDKDVLYDTVMNGFDGLKNFDTYRLNEMYRGFFYYE